MEINMYKMQFYQRSNKTMWSKKKNERTMLITAISTPETPEIRCYTNKTHKQRI